MLAGLRLPRLALIGLAIAWGASARSADLAPLKPATTLAPQDEVLAYAAAHAIATDRIALPPEDGESNAGDTITALVVLHDRKGARQWLTHFTLAPATAKEQTGYG